MRIVCCLLAGIIGAGGVTTDRAPSAARTTLAKAVEAMGGEAALRHITALQIEAIGHDYFIDQSERPEGPFIVRYVSTKELRDVAGGRSRLDTQQRFVQVPDWSTGAPSTVVDADTAVLTRDGRTIPATRQAYQDGRARLELAPERLLLTALEASDLTGAPDERRQGLNQHVVSFTWRGARAKLIINAYSELPTALELTRDDPAGIWGRVTETTWYSLWTLAAGGVRYPSQTDVDWNGVSKSSATITRLLVNPPIEPELFAISDDARRAFDAAPAGGLPMIKLDPARSREIAPGVTQYEGSWNVGVVQQPDGLVILEAPIGSGYSRQVIDQIAARYPGVKIKAVVTTSDAWPHLGGLREYVARGTPIYALDLNQPIVERLLKADYSGYPDALARAPRPAHATWVAKKTVIGSGPTRLELYPARAENGEREMFVYFPALKLLYSSDEIQPGRGGGYYQPEYLTEVRDVVRREHLEVERIFGFHIGATPWSAVEAAIEKVSAVSGPAK